MTELLFWIGACGLALAVGAPLVYLVLFNPPLGKKILLVAASAVSALILVLYIKPDLADRLILGTLQVDQMVDTATSIASPAKIGSLLWPWNTYRTGRDTAER